MTEWRERARRRVDGLPLFLNSLSRSWLHSPPRPPFVPLRQAPSFIIREQSVTPSELDQYVPGRSVSDDVRQWLQISRCRTGVPLLRNATDQWLYPF
ncbi:hypothetical protein EVAR_93596_1 [Eumeta japonica]|uniref:Uncharacterized protein n=1 Tax=Eumeta variegata TaxID=151549 RepID=A0A4C1TQG2_EUMVA|nr:hypothetical protein EVAR_93596_1 [Eumeta japonica]